jgi:hypothetical protein
MTWCIVVRLLFPGCVDSETLAAAEVTDWRLGA